MALDQASISLRPEKPEDESFLFELYASTRADELNALNLPPDQQTLFLKMQFNAQQQGYCGMFPGAEFQIILLHEQPAGRWVVDRAADEIRLVDIALLPTHRQAGLGTAFVQRLFAEAGTAGKPVRLTVLKNHRAARLYQRLGFYKTRDLGMYDEMEWRAGPASGGKA
jgi:ribosomal protein S18 acetylase RimI-like enzyme